MVLPAEEFGAVEKAGLERFEGFHAVLHHEHVFASLRAVGERADIGTDRHGNAGGELFAKLLGVEFEEFVFLGTEAGLEGMLGEIFGDDEGGNGENLFFLHEAHGFVAELIGVVDGSNAGLRGVKCAGFSGGVDGNAASGARGFLNGGSELRFGVLEGRGELAVLDGVGAGFVNFDEVGTFFGLLAKDSDEFVGGVGVIGVGENVLGGIEADGVFMAAENVDGVAADAQTGAGNLAAVDGVAHGGVGRACAFGAHVTFCGEAGHQIITSGERGHDGALRDGFLDGLQVLGAGMEEEMHVSVDETGEQRGITEVEDLRALRMLDGGSDFDDALTLHEDFAGRENFAGVDFEETRGVEHDGLRWRGLGEEREGGESGQCTKTEKAEQRWACDHGRNHIIRGVDARGAGDEGVFGNQ